MKPFYLTLVVAAFCATATAKAQPVKPSADAIAFQESYDREATGRHQEALAALDRLSPGKATSYVALLRRAWLHYRLGKYGPAADFYTKAIAAAPKAVEPRVGILLALMAEGKWAAAEKHARDALKLDPENYLANIRLAFVLYSQGKYAESRVLYQKMVDAYPADVDARSGLGWALVKLRKTKDAAAVFKGLLEFAPKNQHALDGLAALGAS